MYNEFFGFREPPFRITPDPRFLYRNPCYDEACAALTYGLEQRKGFLSLVGEAGTGKTTLLRHLLETIAPSTKTILLLHPTVSFDEILEYILLELGVPVEGARKLTLLTRLNEFLLEHTAAGGNVALLIDEAQDLENKTLEELRLLSNLETGSEKILQILIAGQPELEEKLAMPGLRQLRQRIAMHVRLRPLSPPEVASYVCTRLQHAGSTDLDLFTTDALMRIAELTGGIPRIVNVLCDACLVTAFASGVKRVTPEIVEEAWADYARLTPERPVTPAAASTAAAPTASVPAATPPSAPVVPPSAPAAALAQAPTSVPAAAPLAPATPPAALPVAPAAPPAPLPAAADTSTPEPALTPPPATAVPTPVAASPRADEPVSEPAEPPVVARAPEPALPPLALEPLPLPPLPPPASPIPTLAPPPLPVASVPPPVAAVAAAAPPPLPPKPVELRSATPPPAPPPIPSPPEPELVADDDDRDRRPLVLPIIAVILIVFAIGLYALAWRAQHVPPEMRFESMERRETPVARAPTPPPAVEAPAPPPAAETGTPTPPPAEPAPQAQAPTTVPAPTPAEPPAVAANGVPSEEAARDLVDAYVAAYEARDVEKLVALFASDARQNGRVGRESIGEEYRRAFSQLAAANYELEDLEIEERDKSLILRGPFEIAYRYVSGSSGKMQGTASWEISTRDGKPRIVTFDYDLG